MWSHILTHWLFSQEKWNAIPQGFTNVLCYALLVTFIVAGWLGRRTVHVVGQTTGYVLTASRFLCTITHAISKTCRPGVCCHCKRICNRFCSTQPCCIGYQKSNCMEYGEVGWKVVGPVSNEVINPDSSSRIALDPRIPPIAAIFLMTIY